MSIRARHPLVVCESHPGHGESVVAHLVAFGYDVRNCDDEESLIEAAAALRPNAVVYELHHQLPVDMAILALLRRVLPGVPLVVVAGVLADQAARALRLACSAVVTCEPLDAEELRSVVRAAVRHARRHAVVPVPA